MQDIVGKTIESILNQDCNRKTKEKWHFIYSFNQNNNIDNFIYIDL